MSEDKLLLCTFANNENYQSTKKFIFKAFKPSKINVFRGFQNDFNLNEKDEKFFFFYVIDKNLDYKNTANGTIRVHNKPKFNAYFTINALNELIKSEIGVVDINHDLKWENYMNTLSIISQNENKDSNLEIYKLSYQTTFLNFENMPSGNSYKKQSLTGKK
jgi:hypothetical protein